MSSVISSVSSSQDKAALNPQNAPVSGMDSWSTRSSFSTVLGSELATADGTNSPTELWNRFATLQSSAMTAQELDVSTGSPLGQHSYAVSDGTNQGALESASSSQHVQALQTRQAAYSALEAYQSNPVRAAKAMNISAEVSQFIEWQNAQPNSLGSGTVGDTWKGDNDSEARVAHAQAMLDREARRLGVRQTAGIEASDLFAWNTQSALAASTTAILASAKTTPVPDLATGAKSASYANVVTQNPVDSMLLWTQYCDLLKASSAAEEIDQSAGNCLNGAAYAVTDGSNAGAAQAISTPEHLAALQARSAATSALAAYQSNPVQPPRATSVSAEINRFIAWQDGLPSSHGRGTVGDTWSGDGKSEARVAQAQSMIERESRRAAVRSFAQLDPSDLFEWDKANSA